MAYTAFRFRLACNMLRQLAASLRGSAHIALLVFAHLLVGLFVVIALPPMAASSLPLAQALPLLTVHALLMSIPMLLLRPRLPHGPLPLTFGARLAADAAVAALLVAPLALLYAASCALWLAPRQAWLATLFSLTLTYLASIALLQLPAPRALRMPRVLRLWHRLYWRSSWSDGSLTGWRQSFLLVAASASALPWMQAPPGMARAALALSTATLMVLLTDHGDKAVREQTARLRPMRGVECCARAFTVAPALLVVLLIFAGGLRQGLWQHAAGRAYLLLAMAAPLLLVAMPNVGARVRNGLVIAQIAILAAAGCIL